MIALIVVLLICSSSGAVDGSLTLLEKIDASYSTVNMLNHMMENIWMVSTWINAERPFNGHMIVTEGDSKIDISLEPIEFLSGVLMESSSKDMVSTTQVKQPLHIAGHYNASINVHSHISDSVGKFSAELQLMYNVNIKLMEVNPKAKLPQDKLGLDTIHLSITAEEIKSNLDGFVPTLRSHFEELCNEEIKRLFAKEFYTERDNIDANEKLRGKTLTELMKELM